MSMEGIRMFASVMSIMQETRGELFKHAEKVGLSTPSGHQDIRLAQLLDDAKDSIKEEFCKVTTEVTDDNSSPGAKRPVRKAQGRQGR